MPRESHVVGVTFASGKTGFLLTRLIPESIKLESAVRYLVVTEHDGREVGMLSKYADTKTETFPWQAFLGLGFKQQYLDSFCGVRGRAQALQAIASKL